MSKSISLKRVSIFLLALGMTFLCACGKNTTAQESSLEQTSSTARTFRNVAAEVGDGIVFFPDMGSNQALPILYYWDLEQNLVVPLCGKADCSHDNESCNAYFERPNGFSINYYQDHIYIFMQGESTSGSQLVRIDKDGSNREVVCQIKADDTTWISPIYALIQNDTIYMLVNTNAVDEAGDRWAIYEQPMDGKSKATRIYAPSDDGWNNHQFFALFFYENKLYFDEIKYRDDETQSDIYCYDTITGEMTLLVTVDAGTIFTVQNGALYYETEDNSIIRYDLTTAEQKVLPLKDGSIYGDGVNLYQIRPDPFTFVAVNEEGDCLTLFPADLHVSDLPYVEVDLTPSYILLNQDGPNGSYTWHLYKNSQIGEENPTYLEYTYIRP
jgi:hypothetical protein